MRRHPLAGFGSRIVLAVLAGVLVMGCDAAFDASPSPQGPISLTIATAPGETLAYVPAEAIVVSTRAVLLTLRNDSTVAHNLVFAAPLEAGTRTIVDPGASDQVLLGPLEPGSHPFICTIHDGMGGVLVVTAPAP